MTSFKVGRNEDLFEQYDEIYRRAELVTKFKEFLNIHSKCDPSCTTYKSGQVVLAAHISALNAREPLLLILTQQGMTALVNGYADELIRVLGAYNNQKMLALKKHQIDAAQQAEKSVITERGQ